MARGCVARPLAASSLRIDCSAEEPVPGGCNCPPLLPTPLKPGRPLLPLRDPETQSRSLMRRGRREGGEEEESRRRSTAVFTCSQFSPPSSCIPTPTLSSFSASCQQTTTDGGRTKKKQVQLNFQSECQSVTLIRKMCKVDVLASSHSL